jgi:hypothetical protein
MAHDYGTGWKTKTSPSLTRRGAKKGENKTSQLPLRVGEFIACLTSRRFLNRKGEREEWMPRWLAGSIPISVTTVNSRTDFPNSATLETPHFVTTGGLHTITAPAISG